MLVHVDVIDSYDNIAMLMVNKHVYINTHML